MGLRDRLRIGRIRQGLELPRAIKTLVDTEKTARESVKGLTLIATKCPDITNLTEIKTCIRIMGLLGNPKIPQHVISSKTKEGMCQVIAKLKRAGETSDSIAKFYWDIPEFCQLWGKLGYSEEDWIELASISG